MVQMVMGTEHFYLGYFVVGMTYLYIPYKWNGIYIPKKN